MALITRQPFVGEVVPYTSVEDPDLSFGIKRVGSREVMAHRDRNSVVRYIQRSETDEFVSEKDYPAGTNRVETVVLGLDSWNIGDLNGNSVKITADNILAYLKPEVIDELYEQVITVNPIINPVGGKDAQKKG